MDHYRIIGLSVASLVTSQLGCWLGPLTIGVGGVVCVGFEVRDVVSG